jgi:hypothetical protein
MSNGNWGFWGLKYEEKQQSAIFWTAVLKEK